MQAENKMANLMMMLGKSHSESRENSLFVIYGVVGKFGMAVSQNLVNDGNFVSLFTGPFDGDVQTRMTEIEMKLREAGITDAKMRLSQYPNTVSHISVL